MPSPEEPAPVPDTAPRWPRLAALAVLPRDNRLLLVRRRKDPDAGLWGFPGGHVEPGETVMQAAARELHEETTVIAEPRDYLTNLDIILHDGDGRLQFHFLLVAVLCEYRSGRPEPRDDVSAAEWIGQDRVLDGSIELSRDVDTVLRLALLKARGVSG